MGSTSGDEITGVARNQIQTLIGFQIIGQIYDGDQAERLLQHFRWTAEGQRTRQIPKAERSAKPSPPTEGRAAQQPEPDYLLPPKFFCTDGHRVRSQGEKIIDDWLHTHGVRHEYEPMVAITGGQIIPDFVVHSRRGDPIYIEYWGLLNEPNYDQRRREKTRLYAQSKLPLIQIVPDDLKVVEFVLKKELERWDIAIGRLGFFDRFILWIRRVFSMFRRSD